MIHIVVPGLPPSVNNVYTRTRGGGRALSEEGRKYKRETTAFLAENGVPALRKNVPHLLFMRFYFEDLETKGWQKGKTDRYKKIDVTNRAKILEDCLKDVTCIDDSQNTTVVLSKVKGTPEKSEIWMWDLELEGSIIEDVLRRLPT